MVSGREREDRWESEGNSRRTGKKTEHIAESIEASNGVCEKNMIAALRRDARCKISNIRI